MRLSILIRFSFVVCLASKSAPLLRVFLYSFESLNHQKKRRKKKGRKVAVHFSSKKEDDDDDVQKPERERKRETKA